MKRDQFTFYRSYYEALKSLPKKDRTDTVMAILAYALDEELPKLSGVPLSVFTLIRPTLDSGRIKAENRKNKTKTNQEQNKNKPTSNQHQTGKEGEREKEKEGEVEREGESERENDSYISPPTPSPEGAPKKRFVPPSVDEVRAYCQERGNGIDPQGFVDFYAARGWVVGKTPMKDWKAAVRTWESRENARKPHGKPTAQDMSDDAWRYV